MEEALRTLLRGNAAVAALVGSRVDWGMRPQGSSLPAICLTIVSDAPVDHSLDGPGVSQARVQIDCFGVTYGSAKDTARAVRRLLDAYSGGLFLGVFMAGARDLPEEDGVSTIHAVSMDFLVNYHFT